MVGIFDEGRHGVWNVQRIGALARNCDTLRVPALVTGRRLFVGGAIYVGVRAMICDYLLCGEGTGLVRFS